MAIKQSCKVLIILAKSLESNVNAITEAKNLKALTMDDLIRNLKTYELKKQQDKTRGKQKKEKNLVLKSTKEESSADDE